LLLVIFDDKQFYSKYIIFSLNEIIAYTSVDVSAAKIVFHDVSLHQITTKIFLNRTMNKRKIFWCAIHKTIKNYFRIEDFDKLLFFSGLYNTIDLSALHWYSYALKMIRFSFGVFISLVILTIAAQNPRNYLFFK